MNSAPALSLVMLVLCLPLAAQVLEPTSYTDSASAGQHWEPRFGSPPAEAEALPDGTPCMVFDADFSADGGRVAWDWTGHLDLSAAGRISFDLSATNPGVAGTIAVYFGTEGGWYGAFMGAPSEAWTPRTFVCARMAPEGDPQGWDKITTVRFSVWNAAPGKATFRMRNLRAVESDPGENLLRNGSFEVPGPLPLAWGSGHWGVGNLPWAADMDLWRRHFRLDSTVAREGKTSLLLDNSPDLPLIQLRSAWFGIPESAAHSTLSAWLRSDQEALPVTLQCGERSVRVDVGREWTQGTLEGVVAERQATVIIAPGAPGKLWVDAVQLQTLDKATREFHPGFDDEGLNAREAQVDWSPPGRTPEVAAGRVITGPVQPATVGIDEHGRFLLNDQPYLQHSLGLEFVSDLEMLDVVARAGFRDVTVEVNAGISTERLKAIFDRCAQSGLRVIPWLDGNIPRELLAAHINALKDHPALLIWYVYDEPSGDGFAEATARCELARRLDPSHPCLINYLSGDLVDQTGDIFSTDVYPIPHSSPTAAIQAVATMKAAADKSQRPVWMWLQGTGYAYWMDREPTPRELSCMVYGSLIRGARGVYYFAQVPRTAECLGEMRALCVELDAVAPALGSLEQAPEVTCDQPAVLCKSFLESGELWVLATNTVPAACRARFSLAGAAGIAEVMFEDRGAAVEEEHWEDDLGPYERRVYRIRQ